MSPTIELRKAERAITTAWQAAVVIGVVTAIVSVGGWLGADLSGLLDALLVLGLAFGVYRRSRVASSLLVAYFLASSAFVIASSGRVALLVIRLFIALALVRGCIVTFRFHELQRAVREQAQGSLAGIDP